MDLMGLIVAMGVVLLVMVVLGGQLGYWLGHADGFREGRVRGRNEAQDDWWNDSLGRFQSRNFKRLENSRPFIDAAAAPPKAALQ